MKICEFCGHQIPDGLLVCENCTRLRALASLQRRQEDFLRKVVTGELPLRIGCERKGERHVIMYCSDVHTFCQRDLAGTIHRSRMMLNDKDLERICAGCRIALKSALEEIPQPVVEKLCTCGHTEQNHKGECGCLQCMCDLSPAEVAELA